MASKRSIKSSPSVTKKQNQPKEPTAAQRGLRARGDDGKVAVAEKATPETVGPVYKSRGGARWQDVIVDDCQPARPRKTTGKRKRQDDTPAVEDDVLAVPDAKARKRQRQGKTVPHPEPVVPRKITRSRQRSADTPADEDRTFLETALRQLSRHRKQYRVAAMLPLLNRLEQPSEDDGDCHVLSVEEARALLASNAKLDAPVFVANGSNIANILEMDAEKRPIEQVLDCFIDEKEKFEGKDPNMPYPTLQHIRERFAQNGEVVDTPFNVADMAHPFPEPGRPTFVLSRQCNFLHDVTRYILNVEPHEICSVGCRERKKAAVKCCNDHFLTQAELCENQQVARHWQGTVMLAEAGACTPPHCDQWSLGTWTSCLEGEIGFAWCIQPSNEDIRAVFTSADEITGRWVYKVLRPDDSLYMPPGTLHTVFRVPRGQQTLALAGHAIRRCDVERWLQVLQLETEEALENENDKTQYLDVATGLVTGVRYLLEQLKGKEVLDKYGGEKSIRRAMGSLTELDTLLGIK